MAHGKKLAKPRSRKVAGSGARRAVAEAPALPTLPAEEVASVATAAEPEAAVAPAAIDTAPAGAGEAAPAAAEPSADAIIHLGAQLTLREAVPLRIELLEHVASAHPVGLDASAVTKVDTAGLQVLLAFVQQRRRDGAHLKWTGCSEPVRKAAGLLAVTEALGLPAAEAGA